MKYRIQLSPDDCIAARWVALRPRPSLRLLGYVVLGIIAFVLTSEAFDLARGQPFHGELWWVIGAICYVGFLIFVLEPWRIRRVFKQQKTLQEPFEVEFGDERLAITSTNGHLSVKWTDLHKWKLGKKCILIYQSDAIMHPIPSRVFGNEADRQTAIAFLKSKIGKQEH